MRIWAIAVRTNHAPFRITQAIFLLINEWKISSIEISAGQHRCFLNIFHVPKFKQHNFPTVYRRPVSVAHRIFAWNYRLIKEIVFINVYLRFAQTIVIIYELQIQCDRTVPWFQQPKSSQFLYNSESSVWNNVGRKPYVIIWEPELHWRWWSRLYEHCGYNGTVVMSINPFRKQDHFLIPMTSSWLGKKIGWEWRRSWSDCAFAQSDQDLCHSQIRSKQSTSDRKRTANNLTSMRRRELWDWHAQTWTLRLACHACICIFVH